MCSSDLNPIIEVDGHRATGRWYFFGPFTFTENGQLPEARWTALRYEDDYATDFGRMKAVAWMSVASFGLLYGGSQTGVTPRIYRAAHTDL